MTESVPFTEEEKAALAAIVVDDDGVAFDPAIHATRKDGKPKRTPQGKWALLDKGVDASGFVTDGVNFPDARLTAVARPDYDNLPPVMKSIADDVAALTQPTTPSIIAALAEPEPGFAAVEVPSDDLYDPSNPPPDTDEAAYLAAKKAFEADIEAHEVAKTREALKTAGTDTVLAFLHGGYRAWLPLAEAEKRIKEGTCLRYEVAQ